MIAEAPERKAAPRRRSRTQRLVAVLVALVATAGCALWALSVERSSGRELWSGDFETGDLTQWRTQTGDAGTGEIVRDPVAEGEYATQFRLAPGQLWNGTSRVELTGTGPAAALSDGQVRYFAWSVYLPADFQWNDDWRILAQWKNDGTGSPPLELKLQGREWHLDGGWNGGDNPDTRDPRTAWTGPAESGRWTHFAIGIEFQQRTPEDPYRGWVELWKDGRQVLQRTPWKTLYLGRTSYLKAGLYRSTGIPTTDTIYQDGWKMGTTYDSVAG